ncbi:hypothetical protein PMA3_14485 [Pseudomonas silesiensis]|jgi:hypothetical protein|uniref:Uncharacterized protein n=1 Tax=Pseudomonas silesiensis TaxID=1853130 RepID=A0A191YU19_9PSED|nr:hypothetical protein PMA3_14485 [Pseudomonas silesiensis]
MKVSFFKEVQNYAKRRAFQWLTDQQWLVHACLDQPIQLGLPTKLRTSTVFLLAQRIVHESEGLNPQE